jgi:hypothetical protein
MIFSDVKYVEMCYLALNPGFYTTDLLSELYYRNSRNVSYADDDTYKKAPEPLMHSTTDRKIVGTRIINKHVLDKLREKYGDEWPVGNDTSLQLDTAHHCGFIGEIHEKYQPDPIPEGVDPETWVDESSRYHGIKLSQHWLLESEHGYTIYTDLPIFKNKQGKRLMLPRHL